MNTSSNSARIKSDQESAQLYANRNPAKHEAEMKMLSKAFRFIPAGEVSTALDAPCGVGRISVWLGRRGYAVTAIDLGIAAVEMTRSLLAQERIVEASTQRMDIFDTSFPEKRFDATVCFRLLHHFEDPEVQQQLIQELCRVTKKYVIISYISPYSVTSIRRRLRKKLFNKPIKQYPNTITQLETMFASDNFEPHRLVQRSGFLHSLQLAVFARKS
jgi:2-polyprenyl-3-methyl-5-hydroxy-6-metoxy-1,4-benzoquinol methylase